MPVAPLPPDMQGEHPLGFQNSSRRGSYDLILFLSSILLVSSLVFVGPRVRELFWNTLLFASGSVFLSLIVGSLLALLLVKTKVPGRRLLLILIGTMLFVPLFAVAAGWLSGFGFAGWATILVQSYAPERTRVPLLTGLPGAIWVQAFASIPWVVLIVGIGLRSVETELEEESLLNTTLSRVLWKVTLRRALPYLAAAAVWVACSAVSEMTVTDLFQVRTLSEEIYIQSALGPEVVVSGESNQGIQSSTTLSGTFVVGSSAALLLSLVAFPLLLRLLEESRTAFYKSNKSYQIRRAKWLPQFVVCLLLILVVGLPLVNLIYQAGIEVTRTVNGYRRAWSLGKSIMLSVQSFSSCSQAWKDSIGLALAAALASVTLATFLSWWSRRPGWRLAVLFAFTTACLVLPGPLLGLTLIWLLNQPPDSYFHWLANLYDHPWFAPWLVQTIKAFPLAIFVLWPAFASIPSTQLDAAKHEGASHLQTFFHIALPQRWQHIVVAGFVCVAVALGELSATLLVSPAGTKPLSIHIFQLLHYGVDDQLAGLVLLLYGGIVVLSILCITFLAYSGKRALI